MASRREDLGSWLEGTPGGGGPAPQPSPGAPGSGPVPVAPIGRRLAALAIDWVMSLAVSAAFFPVDGDAVLPLMSGHPLATVAIFGVSTTVLVALLGSSVGHRTLGLRVVRVADDAAAQPPPPGVLIALVRTALLCLVIPAVVWDRSGRGMHDAAAGTVIVRRSAPAT